MFPEDYPWTIREVGDRIIDMYRELDVEVEIEYFEGGFTSSTRPARITSLSKLNRKCGFAAFARRHWNT
jgi:hypothetical protein